MVCVIRDIGSLWNELVFECREISSVETNSFQNVSELCWCWDPKMSPLLRCFMDMVYAGKKYTSKAFLELAKGYLVCSCWTAYVVKWRFLIVLLTEFFKWAVSLRLCFKMGLRCKKGSKAYKNYWGFSVPKFYFKTVISNRVSMFENITLQALNEILWLHRRTVVYFWSIWH